MMKYRILLIVFLLIPFVFMSSNTSLAAPVAEEVTVTSFTYPIDSPPMELVALRSARATNSVEMEEHGTMWQPQFRGHFKWAVKGWGTDTQAGDSYGNTYQWVHIGITYPYKIGGTTYKVSEVVFCANSNNPSQSKPTKVDLWGYYHPNNVRFHTENITWPNDTSIVCHSMVFSPAQQYADLGVSVLIKYANTTDVVTLDMAWAGFNP